MALAESSVLDRSKSVPSVDASLATGGPSGLAHVFRGIRGRMEFLDDQAALPLLGFSVAMATGLLGFSMGIAWLIVNFGLT